MALTKTEINHFLQTSISGWGRLASVDAATATPAAASAAALAAVRFEVLLVVLDREVFRD